MATYTHDDFLKAAAAQGWGQGNGFSDADWKLAQENPDAGMSLLNYKKSFAAARTQDERDKAHQGAETIRKYYGNYAGGADGGDFLLDKPSPADYAPKEEKPTFSYHVESDPVYSAYKKQYLREGDRAIKNALGNTAAATGGIPSSYAATAASQAGDYYASQLSDKVPELYQQAYNRHLNDLSQWNTDRNFGYGQYIDEINANNSDQQTELQKALYGAQYGDYKRLGELGFDVTNIPAEQEKMYNLALQQARLGNYAPLSKLTGKYF